MKSTQKRSAKKFVKATEEKTGTTIAEGVVFQDTSAPKIESAWTIFLRWFSFIAVSVIIYFFFKWFPLSLFFQTSITGLQAVVFGLSLAFVWVEILKWGVVKPFNCLKCMTGWLTLIVAAVFHVEIWYMYLPVGVFVGALFDRIKGRYL